MHCNGFDFAIPGDDVYLQTSLRRTIVCVCTSACVCVCVWGTFVGRSVSFIWIRIIYHTLHNCFQIHCHLSTPYTWSTMQYFSCELTTRKEDENNSQCQDLSDSVRCVFIFIFFFWIGVHSLSDNWHLPSPLYMPSCAPKETVFHFTFDVKLIAKKANNRTETMVIIKQKISIARAKINSMRQSNASAALDKFKCAPFRNAYKTADDLVHHQFNYDMWRNIHI